MKNQIKVELEDKSLFNRIADDYSKKDTYPITKLARKHEIEMLLYIINSKYKKSKFDNVIEIGCGVGANSEYLMPFVNNYTGVDYSSELIKIAKQKYQKQNIKFICKNVKDIELNEVFDLIIGVGFLHHIAGIDKILKKIKTIGNDNSIYLFAEPQNGNPLINLMRKMRKLMDKNYSKNQKYFSKKELSDILTRNGYCIELIRYHIYLSGPFSQIILKPRFIFMFIAKIILKVDTILNKIFNNRLSWAILFICKKNS